MKTKTILSLMVALMLTTIMAGIAEAFTCSMQAPASDGRLSGNRTTYNVTFAGLGQNKSAAADLFPANSNFTIRAAVSCRANNTRNNSYIVVFNTTNTTVLSNASTGQGSINFTRNASYFEDSTQYECFAHCYNGSSGTVISDTATSGTAINIEVDYTAPGALSSPSPAANVRQEVDRGKTQHIKATVDDPTTTACSVIVNFNTFSMNYTSGGTGRGTVCTADMAQADLPAGTYTYTVRASDGTNTTSLSVTGVAFLYNGDMPLSGMSGTQLLEAIGDDTPSSGLTGTVDNLKNTLKKPISPNIPITVGVGIALLLGLFFVWQRGQK